MSPVGLQEMATTLRTVANIRQLSIDAPAVSIAVSGTSSEIAPAAWLVEHLDKPARSQGTALPSEKATFGNSVYLVYYLKNSKSPSGIQEVITTLRTVENIQKIYNYNAAAAIALRGTPAEVEMAEWLMGQLDVPAGSASVGDHAYSIAGENNDSMRVFYLPAATAPRAMQDIVTALRTTGQIKFVYHCLDPRAIAVRAPAARVEIAGRIIAGWQTP